MGDATFGWYGKLPMLGDFVTKELPESFVKPWDQWLQTGMLAGKETLDQAWEDHYLTFPMWRFLYRGDAAEPSYWIGLLMPSLDRVGRLFPLTIAMPLGDIAGGLPLLGAIDQCLCEAQLLAQKLLEDDGLEDFETAVRAIPCPAPQNNSTSEVPRLYMLEQSQAAFDIAAPQDIESALANLALSELLARGSISGLWWQAASADQNGIVRTSSPRLDEALFLDLVHGGI